MGCYGHKLSNGVLFAHHLILGVPGGSSHLAYRRRVPLGHNPRTVSQSVSLLLGIRPYGNDIRVCTVHQYRFKLGSAPRRSGALVLGNPIDRRDKQNTGILC